MNDRDALYLSGLELAQRFCAANAIAMPKVTRIEPAHPYYRLVGSCAFYRPQLGINIAVDKCANRGHGGRAWSWPAYTVDRTPYGVIQHELGHHVDHSKSEPAKSRDDVQSLFSWKIHEASKEPPMTGYLGTDNNAPTFFMEWFAEIFRVFVTNPDLCYKLRPRFYAAITERGIRPVVECTWREVLTGFDAPERITGQAEKKIKAVPLPELAI